MLGWKKRVWNIFKVQILVFFRDDGRDTWNYVRRDVGAEFSQSCDQPYKLKPMNRVMIFLFDAAFICRIVIFRFFFMSVYQRLWTKQRFLWQFKKKDHFGSLEVACVELPSAQGVIGEKSTELHRPQIDLQNIIFFAHKHFHYNHKQVVINNQCNIIYRSLVFWDIRTMHNSASNQDRQKLSFPIE